MDSIKLKGYHIYLFSVAPTLGSLERDVRFIFCAAAISYILNDWSGIDIENTVKYLKSLQVRFKII